MAGGWLAASPVVASARDRCLERGCRAQGAIRCGYVDRRGHGCTTAWCARHWTLIAGHPYCRRHANVMEATAGGSGLGGLPDVDSRAAALVGWIGHELDARVRDVMRRVCPPSGARLVIDAVHLVRVPGASRRRWQRAWKLVDHRGVLRKVSIEVDESDENDVQARVDTDLVGHGVPPWIERRQKGLPASEEQQASERRAFSEAIGRSIELVVTRQETRPRY